MNSRSLLLLTVMVAGLELSLVGQETVTIPKSRLEELERKEAELEKLKGDFQKSKSENIVLKQQHEETAAKLAAMPPAAPAHVSPRISSLPPLGEKETVNSIDLANHYKNDAALANQRYAKQRFNVKGEIEGFLVPPFLGKYTIRLKTEDRDIRVVCDLPRPQKYRAVFITKNGSELSGSLSDGARVPVAKVGDVVIISGRCKGLSDSEVEMTGCELKGLE